MELGTSFLKSKIARRFCGLFILCAFIPTVALIVVSYNRVVNQLEEQSYIRLKREVKSYSLGMFDRLIRVTHDLKSIGRNLIVNDISTVSSPPYEAADISHQLSGVMVYSEPPEAGVVWGDIESNEIAILLSPELLDSDKPFILVSQASTGQRSVFVGVNMKHPDKDTFSIIGEVQPSYLWGVGAEPLLPPMTDLLVYDRAGDLITATNRSVPKEFKDLKNRSSSNDLKVFEYEIDGIIHFASISNLFLESNFQRTGWVIILSQERSNIMSSMDSFKQSFPFIILFFLLLILYLSVSFIRKGLEPLEKLKEGTRRVGEKDFKTTVEITSDDEFEDLGNSFNQMAEKLDQQFNTLAVLGDIDRAILSSIDRSQILSTTLKSMRDFFKCDVAMVVRNSEAAKDHVKVYTMCGNRKNDSKIDYFSLDEGDQKLFFDESRYSVLSNSEQWPSFLQRAHKQQMALYICLPLSVEGVINRFLLMGWRNDNKQLTEDEIDQARQIADQLAVALSNAKLLKDMQNLAMGTIEALARTVDAKSKWTAGHSERVAVLSGRIAKAMGLSVAVEETLIRGGLLHDIGKIGIPVSILNKPDRLTDEEYEEVKTHPEIGANILKPIEAYQDIIPLVKQHHEKFDGSGYPNGLKGDEIDIRARIMAVADVWDAVVSDRPYRAGWIHDKAKKLIIEGAGTHFDPLVVESFLVVISET